MKAFQFHAWKEMGRLDEIAAPEPGPGQTLIRIGGAGACHSDLHLMHEWSPDERPELAAVPLPFTIGHENAGWVEGGDTGGLDIGTPVVVAPSWSCGRCRSCRLGLTNYCDTPPYLGTGGLGLNGGMAEYMVAPASCLVPLNSLEPAEAAPLTDAGLTSYHAVKQCLSLLTPGTAAVVIGVGGLGHLAVEFLRELTAAKIIAVDRDERALEMARERGADLCLPSDENTVQQIMDATDGVGAMAILEFVGIDATMAMAAQSLRQMGRIVLVGIGGGVLPLAFNTLPEGCSLMTTMGGSKAELAEVVALAEAGMVTPHTTRFPLDQAVDVYEKLHANEIVGRAVLIP